MRAVATSMPGSDAEGASERLDRVDRRLLSEFQRGFPLDARPYRELGARLGIGEDEVISRLAALVRAGVVSRVGPVFRPGRLGASTLAAMAVPSGELSRVAAMVSGYAEVNHNYEREHAINLWFVVTAPSRERVDEVLDEIRTLSGIEVLDLPLEHDFHIDLGFPLWPACATR